MLGAKLRDRVVADRGGPRLDLPRGPAPAGQAVQLGHVQPLYVRPVGEPRFGVRWLLAASIALAAVSLTFATHGIAANTYDPTVWLIWGREITHWELVTSTGSSWKPLPVIFTTVFSLFGSVIAPSLWLVVARAGALAGLMLAYRVAARLAGPVAGAIAAVALAIEYDYLTAAVQGISEPLMVAFMLGAVDQHLAGHPRRGFLVASCCALMRPESWSLVALYGLWLMWHDRGTPRFRQTVALVVGAGILVLALWFVPDKLGSGKWLRGASRAREPVPGTPAQSAFPFLATFRFGAQALVWPVYVGGVAATAFAAWAWLRRRIVTAPLLLAGAATVYMITVAALAQGGFTGTIRYVLPPAALVAVLAGVGWSTLGSLARPRFGGAVVALAALIVLGSSVPSLAIVVRRLDNQRKAVRYYAHLYGDLPRAIAKGGGRSFLLRCGGVSTGPYQTPPVAYDMRVHQKRIGLDPMAPGSIVAPARNRLASVTDLPLRYRDSYWVVRSTCKP
jgi:hypothetical protein